MFWSRRFVLSLCLTGLLTGCGFQSLHGKPDSPSGGGNVDRYLAQIEINPIEDRIGQQLRNQLQDLLTPKGAPATPAYRLLATMTVGEEHLAIARDALASRVNLKVNVAYSLHAAGGAGAGQLLGSHRTVVASYNIHSSEYATLESRRSAEARAVQDLARDIQNRLAVFFADYRPPPPTGRQR